MIFVEDAFQIIFSRTEKMMVNDPIQTFDDI